MFKKHSFGFCRCKDLKKHFSIKSDIKWRFWLKNTALAAVSCKKLKLTNLTWNVDYGWKHSFRFCKMLRLQNILCSQIGPKMLFYTFDVSFVWKACFLFLTSLSETVLYRLGSASFRQILREMLIMSQKHSFGFCRCKDWKKHFSIKSDIKWRFWLKNTALAVVSCKKLKVTNLTWNVDYGWKHSFRFCKMLRLQNILCSQIRPKMLFYTFDV